MITDEDKRFTEKYYGKPYAEILETAKKNLRKAHISPDWIDMILRDDDGVSGAYENDIPVNLIGNGSHLWLYLTTD